jgi:hypothetical protein
MRIHTNTIANPAVIRQALAQQKGLGRIASHVTFKRLTEHRSGTHNYAYEVQLEAAERDNGRRAGNSGSYGAMRPEYDGYAATFDEWGWLLAALYLIDRDIVVGTAKHPTYADRNHFAISTGYTYFPEKLIERINEHGDPYPIVTGRDGKTKRGYMIGRRGANRSDDRRGHWASAERPRTVAEVTAFAWPNGRPSMGQSA